MPVRGWLVDCEFACLGLSGEALLGTGIGMLVIQGFENCRAWSTNDNFSPPGQAQIP
jgi:hypothetical protein